MQHVDELTIEMLVLGAPGIQRRRAEIMAHLCVCHGCGDLYVEISKFYAELEATLSGDRYAGALKTRGENAVP